MHDLPFHGVGFITSSFSEDIAGSAGSLELDSEPVLDDDFPEFPEFLEAEFVPDMNIKFKGSTCGFTDKSSKLFLAKSSQECFH